MQSKFRTKIPPKRRSKCTVLYSVVFHALQKACGLTSSIVRLSKLTLPVFTGQVHKGLDCRNEYLKRFTADFRYPLLEDEQSQR